MHHMRICFNEHVCAYVDGIHKSISNQIHKECSHKRYCIVWDIISCCYCTPIICCLEWNITEGGLPRELKMSVGKTEVG